MAMEAEHRLIRLLAIPALHCEISTHLQFQCLWGCSSSLCLVTGVLYYTPLATLSRHLLHAVPVSPLLGL